MSLEKPNREELLNILINVVSNLGWSVAIPDADENDDIPGMIIGTEDYLEEVLNAVDGATDA